MRKIAVLTTTRADWGLIKTVCDNLGDSLRLIVSGTHLSDNFGRTITEIEEAGHAPEAVFNILAQADDNPQAGASAQMLQQLPAALREVKADILLLAGDRFETAAAALAAQLSGVPIAHLAGGETDRTTTPDGNFRNAITKLATWHFATCEAYAQRIKDMGESPENIFVTGLPSLDELKRTMAPASQLYEHTGLPVGQGFILVSHMPVVFRPEESRSELKALLKVLAGINEAVLFTGGNADRGGGEERAMIQQFVRENTGRVFYCESLGHAEYLRALAECSAVVGNSSSGIIETPSFGCPSVTVGSRQIGRHFPDNVIEGGSTFDSLRLAVHQALDAGFATRCRQVENPFAAQGGHAGRAIAQHLLTVPITRAALEKRLISRQKQVDIASLASSW